ncbi:hypothetical protein SRABI91_01653 [Rhodococcoides fascians]|nr:hypothetical protein SRABI91_01653 [Rhodococcus fascians]
MVRVGWFNAHVSDDEFQLPVTKPPTEPKSSALILTVFAGFLIASLSVFLVVKHYEPSWAAEQWGPVAAWFSGIATFVAVGTALHQTKLARDDAAEAKVNAAEQLARDEARHAADLIAADRRLTHELDSTRRFEQLRTIPPIWDSIGNLTSKWIIYREAIKDAPYLEHTQESVDEWMKKVTPWTDAIRDLELVFTTPMMMVSEPHTQAAITELYEKIRLLQQKSFDLIGQALKKQEVELTEITALTKEINTSRKPMTSIVRQYLTDAPPLKPSDERDQ